jgi:NAD(P)-dependent dehydrogenase (short-subunit alcohol dehydrogenase family)
MVLSPLLPLSSDLVLPRFVNNAGIAIEFDSTSESSVGQPIHLTPISIYDKTMRVNARGTFLGCKYAIAQMMKQEHHPSGDRGWIINVSSIAGLVGFPGGREPPSINFHKTEADIKQLPIVRVKVLPPNLPNKLRSSMGVTKFMLTLSVQEVSLPSVTLVFGCSLTGINETAIETAMIKPLTENDESAARLMAAHPWNAFGETKDVAAAAVFLASEDAAFVTGVLLPVDGGYVAE